MKIRMWLISACECFIISWYFMDFSNWRFNKEFSWVMWSDITKLKADYDFGFLYYKHLTYYLISYTIHLRENLIRSSYWWGNWDSEKIGHLLKVIWLIINWPKIWISSYLLQSSCTLPTPQCILLYTVSFKKERNRWKNKGSCTIERKKLSFNMFTLRTLNAWGYLCFRNSLVV